MGEKISCLKGRAILNQLFFHKKSQAHSQHFHAKREVFIAVPLSL